MPADFELDRENRIVQSRAWGRVTDDELRNHTARLKELFDAAVLDSTWAQVMDFTGAENFDAVSTTGIQRLAKDHPWPKGAIRVAIAPGDLAFGLVRMYRGLGEPSTDTVHLASSAAEAAELVRRERSG